MSKKKSELERLQAVWYKKLKESGFDDIEHADGSINSAVPYALRQNDATTQLRAQAIQDYYCMTQHFLNDHVFDNETDKIIWEYYTHGLSYRDIAKLLKTAGIAKISRDIVWRKIKKLEDTMKGLYLQV